MDAQIGELLASYSDSRGVQQQRALSAAALFYLAMDDEMRSALNVVYSEWTEGKRLPFVNKAWVTQHSAMPWHDATQVRAYLHFLGWMNTLIVSMRDHAREIRDFLEGGKKPDWLFEMDPDRDPIEQLIEQGAISDKRIESPEPPKPTKPKSKPKAKTKRKRS